MSIRSKLGIWVATWTCLVVCPITFGQATLRLVPLTPTVPQGGTVTVEVFVENLPRALRGYQTQLVITGGSAGTLTIADTAEGPSSALFIGNTRSDWVFADHGSVQVVEAYNTSLLRMAATRFSGGSGPFGATPKYCGTYIFRASSNANGTFQVNFTDPTLPVGTATTFLRGTQGTIDPISVTVVGTPITVVPPAPANDNCANATNITTDGAITFSTVSATTDGPIPPPTCDDAPDFGAFGKDIWYNYTATCSGIVTISTCDTSTNFDTRLAIYDDLSTTSCVCPGTFTLPTTCDDDAPNCTNERSEVVFLGTQGNCYKVRLGGFGTEEGTGTMTISCIANDACASASTINSNSTTFGSTVNTNVDTGLPACGPAAVSGGVWYRVTSPSTGGLMTASLCTQTPYNSRLTVFEGSTCGGLTCVAGADNNCGNNETISWCSTANTVYYVLVHGGSGASGTFRLQMTTTTCNDNNVCTTDSCSSTPTPACVFTSTTPPTHCCAPSNGSLTVIDDGNPCNTDVCNPSTGQVTHPPIPNGPNLACADTLRCTQDECFNGNCRNLDINTISCINTSDCPAGLGTTCVTNLCRCIEDPTLDLVPNPGTLPNATCFSVGNTLTVRVEMGFAPTPVVGSQFFLEYDLNTMTYIGTQPGRTVDLTSPFSFELQEVVGIDGTTGFGTIDYAVAVPPGGAGGQNPATVAVITFQLSNECDPFLRFRAHTPSSQLLDANSNSFEPETTDMPPIQVNGTPPVLSGCPGNMSAGFDDGEFTAAVSFVPPTAMDSCDGAVSVSCNPPSDFAFPSGTTVVSCSAQNSCGVSASCAFNVTVIPSTVTVSMELSPSVSPAARQRCITFDLWDCANNEHEIVQKTITFTGGVRSGEVVEIPGGTWSCITARDTLHTLLSTSGDLFTANSVNYTATFMGSPSLSGHWLVGGNLNDDGFIDIQDYVRFLAQYLASPNPNTPCGTLPYHADINGSGTVDVADLSFIQIAMFTSGEGPCCGSTAAAEVELPVASVTVKELYRKGLGHLAVGDLNGDDVLDLDDVSIFLEQAPTLKPGELPKPIRTHVHRGNLSLGEISPTEEEDASAFEVSPGRRK